MKFNITAKKLNEVDVNISVELTPEELIASMKQSSEDLKTLLVYKDEIVDGITKIINCYTDNILKVKNNKEEI